MHAVNATEARSFWQRTVGLIGRTRVGEDEAILFEHCSSIHTLFMRIPIDVVFLDGNRRVLKTVENVRPWRPLIGCAGASSVLELAAGEIARRAIALGDEILTPSQQ